MTQAATRTIAPLAGAPRRTEQLRGLIDWAELRRRGWDPEREVFAPDAGDPVFGFIVCKVDGCGQGRDRPGLGLCAAPSVSTSAEADRAVDSLS